MSFSPDTLEKVADIARNLLNERFGDDLVFDPVFAKSLVDHDGDDYIQLYLVFDGDEKHLRTDSALDWTLSMGRLMEPALQEIGVYDRPGKYFIKKSEWEEGPPE